MFLHIVGVGNLTLNLMAISQDSRSAIYKGLQRQKVICPLNKVVMFSSRITSIWFKVALEIRGLENATPRSELKSTTIPSPIIILS